MEKISDEKIKELVEKTLSNPENIIKMVSKYGEDGVYHIDHGQLHINFDDQVSAGWNNDLLRLFPLRYPVSMTAWKGTVAVHFLDHSHVFDVVGTREICAYVLRAWGEVK